MADVYSTDLPTNNTVTFTYQFQNSTSGIGKMVITKSSPLQDSILNIPVIKKEEPSGVAERNSSLTSIYRLFYNHYYQLPRMIFLIPFQSTSTNRLQRVMKKQSVQKYHTQRQIKYSA